MAVADGLPHAGGEGNDNKAADTVSRLTDPLFLLPLAAVLGISALLGVWSMGFESVQLATDAGEKALASLGTLVVIALFVERAQEVYISAWRDIDKARLEIAVQKAKAKLDIEIDVGKKVPLIEDLATADEDLAEYKHKTAKVTYLGGVILGMIVALAGPRILADVVVVHGDMTAWQGAIFNGIDILLTGGLIGGGSEGIHKIVMLLLDFLDKTRDRVNQAPAQQLRG